jgi:hypothetical protein
MMDETDWTLVDFDEPKKAGAPVPVLSAKVCPKCGKEVGRGRYFHVKHCKGVPDARKA